MSVQDNIEQVLRNLHILFSKSEEYRPDPTKIIVDKRRMIDLLTELNKCIYDMMEGYELTKESRDEAERAFQKKGDQIILNASKKAEDVYAASVMYTDNALNNIQDIMKDAEDSVQRIYEDMQTQIREQERQVRSNQMELKAQLQDLIDTQKYLKLIEERNKEIEREKAGKEEKVIENRRDKLGRMPKPSIYANRQTEVKVNQEVLDQLGIKPSDEVEVPDVIEGLDMIEIGKEAAGKEMPKPSVQVRVDKNASYFQWKEKQAAAKEHSQKEDVLEEIDLEKDSAIVIDKEMIKREAAQREEERQREEELRREEEAAKVLSEEVNRIWVDLESDD